jgi:hypothetical protein
MFRLLLCDLLRGCRNVGDSFHNVRASLALLWLFIFSFDHLDSSIRRTTWRHFPRLTSSSLDSNINGRV